MKSKFTKEQEEMQRRKEEKVEQDKQINQYLEQIENKINQSKAKRIQTLQENSLKAARCTSGVREVQRAHSQSIEQLLTHNQEQLVLKNQQMIKNESRRINAIEKKTKRLQEMFNHSIERVRIGREEAMREKRLQTQDLVQKYEKKEKLIEEIKQQQQHEILIKKELHNLKMLEINSNLNRKHAKHNESKSRAMQKLEKMEQIQNNIKEQQKIHQKDRLKIQAYEQQIIQSIIPKFKRQHRKKRVISEPFPNKEFDPFKTQEDPIITTFQRTIY